MKKAHHPVPKVMPEDTPLTDDGVVDELAKLEAERKAIYEKFTPTLREYTQMATEVLALQVQIYTLRFAQEFPDAHHVERPRITSFSAKELPVGFEAMLTLLKKQKVDVADVVYDPTRAEFILYGPAK